MREGKFHEVRRIFRALGNEVIKLERIAIGSLALPKELEPGQWRLLQLEELERAISVSLPGSTGQSVLHVK